MNCAVAFAPEGYGPEAKSIIADLSGFGERTVGLMWEERALDADKGYAGTRSCGFSLPLPDAQTRAVLHATPLSRMPLD